MKEYSDKEIIECLRSRQSYVVRYLSDKYLPMIRHLVIQRSGTMEDARDIFQEGLMIMLEKIDDTNFALTCSFKTYLYCVCENLWKTVQVKQQVASNYFKRKADEEYEEDITDAIDYKTYQEIFSEVFESLDEVSRTILRLYWLDMSPKEM